MAFSDIPDRQNVARITREWFDQLRNAGLLLEQYLGSFIPETTFTIANNQAAAANVTGLVFSSSSVSSAIIDYQVYRNTTGAGATELKETGTLIATYKPTAATWTLTPLAMGGDDGGVYFTITALGQVQYTSTNITGTAATSQLRFKARTFGA